MQIELPNDGIKRILAIVGVSGSGKSVLERNLINDYPQFFHKWQQFSTRKKREGETFGNPYVFVEPDTYEIFKDRLVACVGSQFGKDKYGSIPDFKGNLISTVIVSEEGYMDLMAATLDGRLPKENVKVFTLGLDISYDDLDESAHREGRDQEFLDKERVVLRHADWKWTNGNGKYLQPKQVVHILGLNEFI